MTFDTYNVCAYSCVYCFSQFQKGIGSTAAWYWDKHVSSVNPERVKRMFRDPDKHGGQFGPFIKARRTMQWGGLTDPFDPFEKEFGITLDLLEFFREIEYPVSLSTKGTWWLEDDRYRRVIEGADHFHWKVSIISLDEKKSRLIERGVPTPRERLDALATLATVGSGGVTLRFRPFIIGVSSPRHVELIEEGAKAGVDSVTTEFLCLETRSRKGRNEHFPVISRAAGFDIYEFYRKYTVGSGYLRLTRKVKQPYVDEMNDAAHRLGLRFFVSDADFKERCDGGSCCGLKQAFQYSRGQWTEALLIARDEGQVHWTDFESDLAFAKRFRWDTAINAGGAENRAKFEGFSMYEYLRWCWNHPDSGRSPYHYFRGVLVPEPKVDRQGDVVYRYNAELAAGGPLMWNGQKEAAK
jgi:DNA repair photolyase